MSGRLFDQIAIQRQTAYAQYADAEGRALTILDSPDSEIA